MSSTDDADVVARPATAAFGVKWLSAGARGVLAFLVATRAMLVIPALIGARTVSEPYWVWAPFRATVRLVCDRQDRFPCIWARWDAEHYLMIAVTGYHNVHGYAVRENLAFFPVYPNLVRLLAFGRPELMAWAGTAAANGSFIAACLLLWRQLKADFDESTAWGSIVTLSLFPTSFFFSAIYTESLSLLWAVLVYVIASRRRYVLAGSVVALASVTHPQGIVLAVIPLAGLLTCERWSPVRLAATVLASGAGLAVYGAYLWIVDGSPLVWTGLQAGVWNRTIDWPWFVMRDGFTAALSGFGAFDFLSALLFIGLAALGVFWLPRTLAAYLAASIVAAMLWHAPPAFGLMSMSRSVLVFFPGFVVLARLLDRGPWIKRLTWSLSGIGLLLLTASFAAGSWVD